MSELAERLATASSATDALEAIDDGALAELVLSAEARMGWGLSHVIDVDGSRVFVKRIPVTDLELETPGTRNVYDLPVLYNYGLGSPGFGAFRELEGHLATTHWVQSGETEAFPLLYHHRVLRRLDDEPMSWPTDEEYIANWGGDPNIARYVAARAEASSEIVMFLEHIPHVAAPRLLEDGSDVENARSQLFDAIDVMRSNGMVHFDAHLNNVVTDGRRYYLADFGLVLDDTFDLTAEESDFLRRHEYYDYGCVLLAVGSLVFQAYNALDESDQAAVRSACGSEGDDRFEFYSLLIDRVTDAYGTGLLPIAGELVEAVLRYRDVITFMAAFTIEMRRTSRTRSIYDDERCRELLITAGAL